MNCFGFEIRKKTPMFYTFFITWTLLLLFSILIVMIYFLLTIFTVSNFGCVCTNRGKNGWYANCYRRWPRFELRPTRAICLFNRLLSAWIYNAAGLWNVCDSWWQIQQCRSRVCSSGKFKVLWCIQYGVSILNIERITTLLMRSGNGSGMKNIAFFSISKFFGYTFQGQFCFSSVIQLKARLLDIIL